MCRSVISNHCSVGSDIKVGCTYANLISMVFINGKQFQTHDSFSRKEHYEDHAKIIKDNAMKEWKGHWVSKKGTLDLQKSKRTAAYFCSNVFFELRSPNKLFMIFWSRGCIWKLDASVLILRPACLILVNDSKELIKLLNPVPLYGHCWEKKGSETSYHFPLYIPNFVQKCSLLTDLSPGYLWCSNSKLFQSYLKNYIC